MDRCLENNLQLVVVIAILGTMSIIGNCIAVYKLTCGYGNDRMPPPPKIEMMNLENIKKSKLKSKDIEEYVMEIGEENNSPIVRSHLPKWVVDEYNNRDN